VWESEAASEKPYITIEIPENRRVTTFMLHTDNDSECSSNVGIYAAVNEDFSDEVCIGTIDENSAGMFTKIQLSKLNDYKFFRIEKTEEKSEYAEGELSFAEIILLEDTSVPYVGISDVRINLNEENKISNINNSNPFIDITFAQGMNVDSLNPESIYIKDSDDKICGYSTYFAEEYRYSIYYGELKSDMEYTLYVTKETKNLEGYGLTNEYTKEFTTAQMINTGYKEGVKIKNAILNKTPDYNKSLAFFSATAKAEDLTDGSITTSPLQNGGSGYQYFIYDLQNPCEIHALEIVERGTGYQSDSIGLIVAGSQYKCPVEDMEVIYTLSGALAGNEVKHVDLDGDKYRYIALYRPASNGILCITEFRVFASVETETDGFVIEKSEDGTNAAVKIDITSHTADKDCILMVGAYDENGKAVTIKCFDVDVNTGINNISEKIIIDATVKKVKAVLLETKENSVPAMLFDGAEIKF